MFKKVIRQLPKDVYLERLGSTVIGEKMLHPGNLYLMDLAIQHMPKEGSVIEIGSYAGMSASVILHLMEKHQRKETFYTCDAWVYEGVNDHLQGKSSHIDGRSDITREEYSHYIKSAFINCMYLLNSHRLPYSFHCSSQDFFQAWNKSKQIIDIFQRKTILGGAISFAYIDGDHSLEQTQYDFEQVDPCLLPGGYILFDDSGRQYSFGSKGFMEKMKKNKHYHLVQTNPNYLFIKNSPSE